jgi:hypothetical protein
MQRPLKLIGGAALVVLVIGGICLFSVFSGGLGSLFGGSDPVADAPNAPRANAPSIRLGQMYTALAVDANGCPLDTASAFYRDDRIYVGAEQSDIARGAEAFLRVYRDGQPVEDTPLIQADRDLRTCIWFELTPSNSVGFEPGDYQAELIVNGQVADQVAFRVEDTLASQGSLPNTGAAAFQLPPAYATNEVSRDGCPLTSVSDFYRDEPVYIAMGEAFIPAGTEIFVRLLNAGQAIEDTDPIRADRDLQTCVWFEFTGGDRASGLAAGDYTAQVYVNGQRADSVAFRVR